jgi:hypothetical protein
MLKALTQIIEIDSWGGDPGGARRHGEGGKRAGEGIATSRCLILAKSRNPIFPVNPAMGPLDQGSFGWFYTNLTGRTFWTLRLLQDPAPVRDWVVRRTLQSSQSRFRTDSDIEKDTDPTL